MRRMITSKLVAWVKSLFNHIAQNGNTTEIGGNLEVDGNVQINQSITDSEGNEAIDIGTEDVSVHKNLNVGSTDEEEDAFISGDLAVGTLNGNSKILLNGQELGAGGVKLFHHLCVYDAIIDGYTQSVFISLITDYENNLIVEILKPLLASGEHTIQGKTYHLINCHVSAGTQGGSSTLFYDNDVSKFYLAYIFAESGFKLKDIALNTVDTITDIVTEL